MFYFVDHTSRFGYNTGIQRCVRAIASALIAESIPLRPLVWDFDRADFAPVSAAGLKQLARWSGPVPDQWTSPQSPPHHPTDSWLLMVEMASGPHRPTLAQLRLAAVRRGWQLACVFHDAIPLRWAHLYGSRSASAAAHHGAYMAGLADVDLVLANSHTTASHLREFWQRRGLMARFPVQALPLAMEFPGVSRPDAHPPLQPRQPVHLLCVASLEPRKNHIALLKAVALLSSKGRFYAELVLVGWANDPRVVALVQRALVLGLPLRWESNADDHRLAQLYRWCHLTVYPSLEEGFGLPVAESLWQRRPCVCRGDGALGELSADGGCLPVDTSDWRALANGLDRFLHEPDLRQRLQRELHSRPLRTWSAYAQALLQRLDQPSNSHRCQRPTA